MGYSFCFFLIVCTSKVSNSCEGMKRISIKAAACGGLDLTYNK